MTHWKLFILANIIAVLRSFAGVGQDTIHLNSEQVFVVGNYISVAEDPVGLHPEDSLFAQLPFRLEERKYPYNINTNNSSYYWIKFIVKAHQKNGFYLLEMQNPNISYAELFYDKGKFESVKQGMTFPFGNRKYNYRKLIFEIPVEHNQERVFYLKVKSASLTGFSFIIHPNHNLFNFVISEYLVEGVFYGILILVFIYNLFLFFSLKDKSSLFHCLYVLTCGLFTLSATGLGFQLLWSSFPEFNIMIKKVSGLLLLISFFYYAATIIELKNQSLILYKLVTASVIAFVLYFIIRMSGLFHSSLVSDILYFTPFLLIFVAALISLKSGTKTSLYFFIGYLFIPISFFLSLLERYDIVKANLFSVYGFQMAVVFEIVFFSLAVTYKLRRIKIEREEALIGKNKAQQTIIEQLKINEELKDKVNKELEQKVLERTKRINEMNEELVSLNDKLKEQAEIINQWNIQLDKEKRYLEKNIQQVEESRVLNKQVSLEDFNKIFPDETSCFRFIEQRKWGEGFTCTKCGHSHYCQGRNIFSRKCTKCRYEESVIKNTIFEGSKLPLNNLFSMLFLIFQSDGKISSTDISRITNIRLKTCWAFHKKVEELIKKRKLKTINGWDSLILLNEEEAQSINL
ncbi:MAG: 7TM diverse intracellular signaling domain-containing protein [Cytophagaceae bacterium]